MKQREIIGFSGKRGTGKTTASLYLAKEHGFKIISFGNSLREMAQQFFPFRPVDFSSANKEKPYKTYDWSPRDFMIALGKFARYHDEDYWVKKACVEDSTGPVAIDDVRFPNEVAYLKSLDGKIVRLERFENLNIYGKDLDDPSETSLDDYKGFDYTIEKPWNIDLPGLHSRLDLMLNEFNASSKENE